jgi:hypothetical protein
VPLIFLDTPQVDLLERVRRTDHGRYSSFRDTWERRRCTLVLTLAQEGELRRYSDDSRREGRYQVLADLAPIRRDVPTQYRTGEPRTLIAREIVRAVLDRGLTTGKGPEVDKLLEWAEVLPGSLNAREAGLLTLSEDEALLDLFNREQDAARFAAAAVKFEAQSKKKVRVRDLPSGPIPTEKALDYRTEIEKVIASTQEQSRLGNLPPIPPDILPVVRSFLLESAARMVEIGPREALLERLRVARSTDAEELKLTLDELVTRHCFEVQVRYVARELLGASEYEEELLVRKLDFADCPGSWLQRRVDLCVRRGSSEPDPSHHHDAERLAYLPYVDLLFTDAEMAEFVRQIRTDKSTPERIREARAPLSIAYSIEALQDALDSLDATTSG